MFRPYSLLLLAIYGISWAWAPSHPIKAFLFLMMAGLLASLPIMLEGMFKALPYIILGMLLSAFTALFPPLAIIEIIFLICIMLKKMKKIMSHFFLILVGLFTYAVMILAPSHLAHAFFPLQETARSVILFGIGFLVLLFLCYLLVQMGYDEKKTPSYLVGFPAFIFLIIFALHDFSGGDGSHS